jgi:hypothetical protein
MLAPLAIGCSARGFVRALDVPSAIGGTLDKIYTDSITLRPHSCLTRAQLKLGRWADALQVR